MPVMDEFKEEREALKHGTLKQKLGYFWDYYKWHLIGGIVLLVVVVSFLSHVLGQKTEVFYAAMLNSTKLNQEGSLADQFLTYTGIDPADNQAILDDAMRISFDYLDELSIYSVQKLSSAVASGQLDVIVAGDDLFAHYAMEGVLSDLRDSFTQEQLDALSPYLYYVDRPVMEQVIEDTRKSNYVFNPDIPDPTRPDQMADPVPVGVYVESSELLTSNYYFAEGDRIVVGLMPNSSRKDMSQKFIAFLLGME